MNTELMFDGMTWGELRAFVAMADHTPDAEEVGIGYDEYACATNSLWVRHDRMTALPTAAQPDRTETEPEETQP